MVILYSLPHCPRCELLEQKLATAAIPFEKITDRDSIEAAGLMSEVFPILDVDGLKMKCAEAIRWLNKITEEGNAID